MRNPLTVEAFAAFCEGKPADEAYDYCMASSCAVAQFLQAVGVQNFTLMSNEIPGAFQGPVTAEPWTFGALAERLRAASES